MLPRQGSLLHAQAIARSHRIGQTKEVRVIHFEAVADADVPAGAGGAPMENGEVRPAVRMGFPRPR